MSVPHNVLRFEALMLASLLIDTVSAAFDPGTLGDVPDGDRAGFMVTALLFLGFVLLLIWLAARRGANWARWALTVLVVLSVWAYLAEWQDKGVSFGTLVDALSLGLSGVGLYYAFTGDAKDWFRRGRPT